MKLPENSNNHTMKPLVVSRAPLLISLGVTNYLREPSPSLDSRVLNIAIGYYVYVIISPSQGEGVQLIYNGQQVLLNDADFCRHNQTCEFAFSQAIARHFGIQGGTRLFIASQLFPAASLGLVGSLGVALIKGLAYACGVDLDPKDVVDLACYIADKDLDGALGDYSQYASAFGGIGLSRASGDRLVYEQLDMSRQTCRDLEKRLMLFSIRKEPFSSSRDLQGQAPCELAFSESRPSGQQMSLVLCLRSALETGDLESVGDLLHRYWEQRGRTAADRGVEFHSGCYALARQQGASGGTSFCANGSSWFVFYCRESCQDAVVNALAPLGWQRWPLTFAPRGVTLLEALPWQRHNLPSSVAWTSIADPALSRRRLLGKPPR